jgi:hypothetical protein
MIVSLECEACGHNMNLHAPTDIGYGACVEPDCDCRGWDGLEDE